VLIVSVGFPLILKGQQLNSFNYNIDNGLPSNYAYSVLTDHLGYLWIATEKGVAKYNGYDFKIFNQSNGISNEDVWELCEDRKGRMWLSNISDEIGYIYNNSYHKFSTKGISSTIYPKDARPIGNGIVFFSNYINKDWSTELCFANDNGFFKYNLTKLFQKISHKPIEIITVIDENGDPVVNYDNYFYRISLHSATPRIEFLGRPNHLQSMEMRDKSLGVMDNHLVSYATAVKAAKLIFINLNNRTVKRIQLKDLSIKDNLDYVYFDIYGNKHLYFITNNKIVDSKFDGDNLVQISTTTAKQLLNRRGINAGKISSVHKDRFWGTCITTTTNGIWLEYNDANHFKLNKKINLESYRCVGKLKDSLSFWWSSVENTIIKMDNRGGIKYYRHLNLRNISNIIPYSKDTFLVNNLFSYFFNSRTGKLSKRKASVINIQSLILDEHHSYYAAANSGFVRVNKNDSVSNLDKDRYNELVYDSLRQNCWAYNSGKIYIYGKNSSAIIQKEGLYKLGIDKAEKIVIDNKYGNIFLKGSNNITIYDYEKNTYRELFKQFNLKESIELIHDGKLIVAGRMGILFSKILGRDIISLPLFYANLKNKNFNFVYDCVVSGKKLLLNTDKGFYSTFIPNDSEIFYAQADSNLYHYKLILSNDDSVRNFKSGDTLLIKQRDEKLLFDIINPYGNGHPKYIYKLPNETQWYELNSNELTLPSALEPGNHYNIGLKIYDDAWKSDIIWLCVYMRPFWYQTSAGRHLIEITILVCILLILVGTIWVTRKSVLKAVQKRNLRIELELRSIYAQLNPHFVFNTLNSALNLITKEKLEDAKLYISKFAKLLRSYLNSSRNKFITLSDELDNIKNYIEIQQTRFSNMFTYEIIVGALINTREILIPSLLLQPIVENAINHGLLPKETDGHLKIQISVGAENEIKCIIDDNGIGRKKSAANKETSIKESHGTNLINDLIDVINKYEKINIEISYLDKEAPLTGTTVQLTLKYRDNEKI